jgi:hypothetical protein
MITMLFQELLQSQNRFIKLLLTTIGVGTVMVLAPFYYLSAAFELVVFVILRTPVKAYDWYGCSIDTTDVL